MRQDGRRTEASQDFLRRTQYEHIARGHFRQVQQPTGLAHQHGRGASTDQIRQVRRNETHALFNKREEFLLAILKNSFNQHSRINRT